MSDTGESQLGCNSTGSSGDLQGRPLGAPRPGRGSGPLGRATHRDSKDSDPGRHVLHAGEGEGLGR